MVFRHALGCLTLIGAALVAKGAAAPSRAAFEKSDFGHVYVGRDRRGRGR
jgi:hypothetical protein